MPPEAGGCAGAIPEVPAPPTIEPGGVVGIPVPGVPLDVDGEPAVAVAGDPPTRDVPTVVLSSFLPALESASEPLQAPIKTISVRTGDPNVIVPVTRVVANIENPPSS
jgi:hypothetical protein